MNLTTEDIQNEIDMHVEFLDTLIQLKNTEAFADEYTADTAVSELIDELDLDSEDFHLGYEQGYLAGLHYLLSLSKETVL